MTKAKKHLEQKHLKYCPHEEYTRKEWKDMPYAEKRKRLVDEIDKEKVYLNGMEAGLRMLDEENGFKDPNYKTWILFEGKSVGGKHEE